MPSKAEHDFQYKHNRKLIDTNTLGTNAMHDWTVTLAFYSALHLVEGALAPLSYESHSERNRYIGNLSTTKEIAPSYLTLYRESRKARYDCIPVKPEKAKMALEALKKIEAKLCS